MCIRDRYNPATLCLMTGPAALLLCGNAAGKAIDAHTIRDNFTLVSAGMDPVSYTHLDVYKRQANGGWKPPGRMLCAAEREA